MSCGRQQCTRATRGGALLCRCGTAYCSEACFVSDWHADHGTSCPCGEEIRREVAEVREHSHGKSGTALLVGVALSKAKPLTEAASPAPPEQRAPTTPEGLKDCAAGLDGDAVARGPSASTAATAPSRSPSSSMSSTAEAPDGRKRNSVTKLLKRYNKEDFVTIGDSLGNGSYGSVVKVKHTATGEIFAMKAIPKKKVQEHQMNAYLFREVITQFRMDHPNIIKLHYWFEDASYASLLLEYADGGSLFSVMRKRQRVPEPEAARLFLDVSAALHYLHRKEIVHRDLKPENILMVGGTDTGQGAVAKLADFGWCGELKKDGEQRNTFCGTWDYLSPEMVENEPHGPAVDVWAMGVLLYEMLCGRPPFTDPSQKKAMDRITQVDLRFADSTPVLARDLMRALLKREPDARLTLEDAIRQPWVRQFIPDAQIDGRPSMEVAGGLPDRPCRLSGGPPPVAEAPPPAAPEPSPIIAADAAQDAEQEALAELRALQEAAQAGQPRLLGGALAADGAPSAPRRPAPAPAVPQRPPQQATESEMLRSLFGAPPLPEEQPQQRREWAPQASQQRPEAWGQRHERQRSEPAAAETWLAAHAGDAVAHAASLPHRREASNSPRPFGRSMTDFPPWSHGSGAGGQEASFPSAPCRERPGRVVPQPKRRIGRADGIRKVHTTNFDFSDSLHETLPVVRREEERPHSSSPCEFALAPQGLSSSSASRPPARFDPPERPFDAPTRGEARGLQQPASLWEAAHLGAPGRVADVRLQVDAGLRRPSGDGWREPRLLDAEVQQRQAADLGGRGWGEAEDDLDPMISSYKGQYKGKLDLLIGSGA